MIRTSHLRERNNTIYQHEGCMARVMINHVISGLIVVRIYCVTPASPANKIVQHCLCWMSEWNLADHVVTWLDTVVLQSCENGLSRPRSCTILLSRFIITRFSISCNLSAQYPIDLLRGILSQCRVWVSLFQQHPRFLGSLVSRLVY